MHYNLESWGVARMSATLLFRVEKMPTADETPGISNEGAILICSVESTQHTPA